MITVKPRIRAEEVRLGAQHVLFVEGRDENSVDPTILKNLLPDELRIQPLGPSFSVRSVAQALHKHHPTYYFLIDRDHHGGDFVDRCWKNFPNPETDNLLVWRRREIENYFLDAKYLCCSEYCRTSESDLSESIVQYARERVYLDVANQVIVSLREELKRNWVKLFRDVRSFSTKKNALAKLGEANEFDRHRTNVSRLLSFDEIEHRFLKFLEIMTGGQRRVVTGEGKWLHFIRGKKVLNQVVHSSHFRVKELTGTHKLNAIVQGLLDENIDHVPRDFITLRDLMRTMVKTTV